MIGLFGMLDLGARSLGAEQEASEVTGNNLANVNNNAYAREQAVIDSSTPLETPIGEEGNGVDVTSVAQFRSAFLDSQITAQNSVTGSFSSQQSDLQNAEAYLNEQIQNTSSTSAGSPNGITASLSKFFASFSSLSTNPGSQNSAARRTVVTKAQDLSSQFNQLSAQLSTMKDGINQSIQSDAASSNQDLSDIAALNQQIASATDGSANTLVDERQEKIEDLASKVSISTSTEANGSVDISIGGVAMVTGFTTPDKLQAYDAGGGQFLVRAKNAGTTLSVTGGSIGGNIAARDGALASLQTGLDSVASNLASSVNAIYFGATGQNFFTGSNASTLAVSASLVSDPSTLQAGVGAVGDNSVAKALGELGGQPITGLGNQTFTESYDATVSSLGNAIDTATDQVNNSQAVAQMLNNQRSSISGVNTDEEMTNLMEYQKAYEASAELISTVNSMLETVINMKQS